jgi:hypothetical protein
MLRHVILVAVLGAAACAGAKEAPPGPTSPYPAQVTPETRVDRTAAQVAPVEMKPLVPSAYAGELKALGLEPQSLPPLARLDPAKLRKVMQTFTKSLGVRCADCHLDDYAAPTPKKRIAARMWDELVRGLAFPDGSLLYCDSCHQGRVVQLDRRDKKALGAWMDANFVDKLHRRDGAENGCATCHGDSFEPKFLSRWAKP